MEKNDEFLSNKRDNLCLEDNDKKNNFSKSKVQSIKQKNQD